ncbi:MAG: lipopolysaccharide heptosyltransferase [Pseudomonadota bacterium]
MVMVQSLLMRLKQQNPATQIDVFAPAWVAPLLARMPQVSDVIANPFGHGALQLGARRALGKQLRAKKYSAAYVLPNSLKSALIPFFAGIPKRIGFKGEARYGLINVMHKLDEQTLPLMVERFAILAQSPSESLQRPVERPALQVTNEMRSTTLKKFNLHGDKPAIAFCPGAEYGPAKRWPTKHFGELAKKLIAQNYQVWILGSAKEAPLGAEIQAASGGICIDLTGKTNLGEVIDLISASEKVVSNDSGLMHLAAALDKPTAALFGSTSPGFTPPLSDQAKVISLKLECSPCFKRECPLGHFNCMNNLSAEMVLEVLRETGKTK